MTALSCRESWDGVVVGSVSALQSRQRADLLEGVWIDPFGGSRNAGSFTIAMLEPGLRCCPRRKVHPELAGCAAPVHRLREAKVCIFDFFVSKRGNQVG